MPPFNRRQFLAVSAAGTAGAALAAGTAHAAAEGITVRVGAVAGRGMPLVGFNTGHFMPNGNTAAWIEYAAVNAVRFFANLSAWCPDSAFDPGSGVETIDDFDARKSLLRKDSDRYIDWRALRQVWSTQIYPTTNHYNLDYQIDRLHRLGITPIMEAAEFRWNSPWSGLWLMWQKHYAFTHHLASRWGVERYNFVNEPDHPSAADDIVDQTVYIRGLQIAADAIRAAIADVNAEHGRKLRAIVQAPVITHASQTGADYHMDADPDADARDDEHGWGEICLRNLRTDYHGDTVDHDLFDVFDTHLYNKTAATYTYELEMMRAKMREYTPTGVALPIVYSEFNRRNTGAFETSGDDLNTPMIFSDLAEIWGATLTGGAEGMICFKFDNTVRANGIPYGTGHYYVENAGDYNIRGAKKAAEANRMFADRFAARDGRVVLAASVTSAGPAIMPGAMVASHDRDLGRCSLWLPHRSSEAAHPLTIDLSGSPVRAAGATVIIREVSAVHSGDVIMVDTVPESGVITANQPADCVWLITLLERRSAPRRRQPFATVGLTPGGATATLPVGRGGTAAPGVGYLAFEAPAEARSAILELDGAAGDGSPLTFQVYALSRTDWAGDELTWESAPCLDPDEVRADSVGREAFPAGQLTAPAEPGVARLDVTRVLGKARQGRLGFLLVRERAHDEDTADDGRRAEFTGARLVWWS
ncbi:twin-arginine translocation signal domain-containing protein [Microlunatus parietis]|uniref:Uncharacterized protein n=1 Tax=Microlunatus parietis TaxID=682979 RepID=A0A7Y9IB68_9ACTN|nr:twin-arginine translocation signal domain-containing protein [Microlunatus parietis]NYE73629.1 hypothetical protein [Microlunatus parietis]